MKVIILTEGGKQKGFGHLGRCIALYQGFQKERISCRLFVRGDRSVNNFLNGLDYIRFDWLRQKKKLIRGIQGIDVVVVDSYDIDLNFCKEISQNACLAVYFDDNKRLNYPAGVVVNGSIYAGDLAYPRRRGKFYLLGIKFTPIRKEFLEVSRKKIPERIKTVFISFGGSDSKNITEKAALLLSKLFPQLHKIIVLGGGVKNGEKINKLKDHKTLIVRNAGAGTMKTLMSISDIAISAGGQTLYELARIGVPTIAVSVADNQLNNIKKCQQIGFIKNAGPYYGGQLTKRITRFLHLLNDKKVRSRMSRAGRKSVDGLGCTRIVKYIINKAGYNRS